MATRLQILCINKTDRQNAHERISRIGGKNYDGSNWRLTLDSAIASIEKGEYEFYVSVNGNSVNVIIAKSALGNKYLKTVNDGEHPNNFKKIDSLILIA